MILSKNETEFLDDCLFEVEAFARSRPLDRMVRCRIFVDLTRTSFLHPAQKWAPLDSTYLSPTALGTNWSTLSPPVATSSSPSGTPSVCMLRVLRRRSRSNASHPAIRRAPAAARPRVVVALGLEGVSTGRAGMND